MNKKELLIETKALLAKGWIQRIGAADINGECTTHDKAVRFCSIAALWYTNQKFNGTKLNEAMKAEQLLDSLSGGSMVIFNDREGQTLENVFSIFDQAIAQAE